jgi:serine/threonine-protein kinase
VAITEEEITPPSRMATDYPASLEAVVLKALERDPTKRYQTAVEFARDLEQVIARAGVVCGPEEVAEFMTAHFADRIAERDALLRAAVSKPTLEIVDIESSRSGSRSVPRADHADAAPAANALEAETRVEIPDRGSSEGARDAAIPARTVALAAAPRATAPSTTARRTRALAIALALVGFAGIGAAAWFMRATSHDAPAQGRAAVRAPSAESPHRAPLVAVSEPAAPPSAPATPPSTIAPSPTSEEPARATATPAVRDSARSTRATASSPSPSAPAGAANVHAPQGTSSRNARTPSGHTEHGSTDPAAIAQPGSGSGSGYLTFMSATRAEVFDGSHSLGTTPLADVQLSAGRHHLRIVPADGSPPRETDVTIERNATAFIQLR